MPAGLLLSPTARTVRSGPGRDPRGVAAAGRRSLASPAGTTSGPFEESPVGAVPFSVMRRPSSGLRLRRFPLIPAPEPPSSRAIPGKMVGAKARPQAPPSPPGSRYGFPPLPGETRILPALPPLTGVSLPASSCAPCRKRSSPCFPLPDLLRSGASVPLLPGQKIVRSTSIFPAIPAPLCKEK